MSVNFEKVKNCPFCGKVPRFTMHPRGYCFTCTDSSCKGTHCLDGHEKLDVAAGYWNEWVDKQEAQ